jgi:hypothetical protein
MGLRSGTFSRGINEENDSLIGSLSSGNLSRSVFIESDKDKFFTKITIRVHNIIIIFLEDFVS